jgi:hypothetical protein
MNVDGQVNFGDIGPFALAVNNPSAYQAQYCMQAVIHGDLNDDGIVNMSDLGLFVQLLGTEHISPDQPDITGSTTGVTGNPYDYILTGADPENDPIQYGVDWDGDSLVDEWTSFSNPWEHVTLSHSWFESGTYQVMVKARDTHQLESPWSVPLEVQMHYPPDQPSITGPMTVLVNTTAHYMITGTDPENSLISYGIDWDGDQVIDEWTEYYASGEPVPVTHAWLEPTYAYVTVKAKNSYGLESYPSEQFYVIIVRLGDMNNDGLVDFGDINPFVLALSDPVSYFNAYWIDPNVVGDINRDGVLNFGDINPFVELLMSQ